MHIAGVSGMMTLVDCLFSRAFKEKTNMWFPLGRQEAGKKEVKRGLKEKKSDQWRKEQQ